VLWARSGRALADWAPHEGAEVQDLAFASDGSRLATVGEDDAVHIGPETCRRLGPGFVIDDLGEQRLKNLEEPVRVFRVQEREAESRPWPLTATVPA